LRPLDVALPAAASVTLLQGRWLPREIDVVDRAGASLEVDALVRDGVERFRHPDDDLPSDFADRRASCYERLGIPFAEDVFIVSGRREPAILEEPARRGSWPSATRAGRIAKALERLTSGCRATRMSDSTHAGRGSRSSCRSSKRSPSQ
jgi:hypothetical protein